MDGDIKSNVGPVMCWYANGSVVKRRRVSLALQGGLRFEVSFVGGHSLLRSLVRSKWVIRVGVRTTGRVIGKIRIKGVSSSLVASLVVAPGARGRDSAVR